MTPRGWGRQGVARRFRAVGGGLAALAVWLVAALPAAPRAALAGAVATAARWVDSALEDLARGRWESALGKLRLAGWSSPQDAEARVLLAWALAARNEWQQAVEVLGAADLGSLPEPARVAARGVLAMAHQALGSLQPAAQHYGALAREAPGAALAEKGLGELALNASRDERLAAQLRPAWPSNPAPGTAAEWRSEAERHLRAAVGAAPERIDLYLELAEVLMEARRLQQAEAVLREAIRVDFRAAEAHFALGRLYEQQGNLTGAAAAYRRALELDPSFLPARLRLEHLGVPANT